uniref:(northern house mosquito) hypothetical protein n=1 Tax=Culex pipiens TaxID=7175 RepID=A0A8D8BBY9_CULPI
MAQRARSGQFLHPRGRHRLRYARDHTDGGKLIRAGPTDAVLADVGLKVRQAGLVGVTTAYAGRRSDSGFVQISVQRSGVLGNPQFGRRILLDATGRAGLGDRARDQLKRRSLIIATFQRVTASLFQLFHRFVKLVRRTHRAHDQRG